MKIDTEVDLKPESHVNLKNTNIRKLTGETHIMHAYDIENKTNQTASGLKDQFVGMVILQFIKGWKFGQVL